MIDSCAQPHREPQISLKRGRIAVIVLLAAVLVALALPGAPHAATTGVRGSLKTGVGLKRVTYRGLHLKVPASWPVVDLSTNPQACVRFNRHALYLGTPGVDQLCPLSAVGRTEAILVSPAGSASHAAAGARGVLTPVSNAGAAPGGGTMARFVDARQQVVITATWNRHPATVLTALGISSLRAASNATNGHRPQAARVAARQRAIPRAVTSTSPATPGEVYNGLGFDACTAPSETALSAWGTASPFGAVGVYIGGANMACSQVNLSAAWVSAESAAGWHLVPIYVGLQAPGNGCRCAPISASAATTEGTAAAQDAVAQAQTLGIGTGNPIYFDMEGYTRSTATTAAVLAFLEAWTEQLHLGGYESGVYSSGASGISDLVSQVGTTYVEPDDIWIADWNGQQTTVDAYVPATDWPTNQRLHQYQGAETESYGGVAINVDSDYVGGATAAAGSASLAPPVIVAPPSPSLTVSANGNGTVDLTPQWTGEPGLAEYQILGGDSAGAMTPIETVPSTQSSPIVINAIYSYFEVQGLNVTGQVLGSSAAVASQATVAVFSSTAFVSPRGKLGIPVACMNAAPCKVQTVVYTGKRRIASAAFESVSRHGGFVHLALGKRVNAMVADSPKHELPVNVTVTNGAGASTKTSITLISYTTTGKAPYTSPGSSTTLQVLGDTELVSNGWIGEVLVACTAGVPCKTALRVSTPSGQVIARGKTPTIAAGEIAELHFQMTAKGHALLRASRGNQLDARVVVSATLAGISDPAASVAGPAVVRARVSLVSY
jgi:Domain of unknown function (DUF1906)